MSEIKKLTEEELASLKNLRAEYNTLVMALGELSIRKSRLLEEQKILAEKENNLAKQLTDKYGQGSINIDTGEITPVDYQQ
jgi:hypothetical protein